MQLAQIMLRVSLRKPVKFMASGRAAQPQAQRSARREYAAQQPTMLDGLPRHWIPVGMLPGMQMTSVLPHAFSKHKTSRCCSHLECEERPYYFN